MDDDGDVNIQELNVSLENGIIFQGFNSLYKQVFDIKDQLHSPEVQTKAEKHLMTLKNRLNHFRRRSKRSASKPNAKNFKTYAK